MVTKRLIGTDLDQIPRNKDLGANAYIDSDYAVLTNAYIKNAELTGVASTETYNSNTPVASPTFYCDFAKTKTVDSRITFLRDSIATYTDADGLIKTVQPFQPRFDHDPITGKCKGVLVEEERTNILDYTRGYYLPGSPDRMTISNYLGLDGTTTARKFTTVVGGQSGQLYTAASGSGGTYTPGITYTFSTYVKALDPTIKKWWFLIHNSAYNDNTTTKSFVFNTETASVENLSVIDGGAYIVDSVGIVGTGTYIRDGWWRLTITGTVETSTNGYPCWLRPLTAENNTVQLDSYITATDVFATWGNQVEVGSFATSLIPTTNGPVTRKADQMYISGPAFTSIYNPNEGTLVGYAYAKNGTPGYSGNRTEQWLGLTDGNSTNRIFFTRNSGNGNLITVHTAAGQTPVFSSKDATNGVYFKEAHSFSTTHSAAYNGISLGSITPETNSNFLTMNKIVIGSAYDSANGFWNSTIAYVAYYPKKLTEAELQEITYL